MKLKKQSIFNLIKAVVFVLILAFLVVPLTYLCRPTNNGRTIILDYYEEENELDMVYIGASSVIYFWDPMRAWAEQGFASRNYAVISMNRATILPAIKDALKTQNPQLLIIDARRFGGKFTDVGAKTYFTALDIGKDRKEAIDYYCERVGVEMEDAIPFYFDLLRYHDNYSGLRRTMNWELIDNRLDGTSSGYYKGYKPYVGYEFQEQPTEEFSDIPGELDELSTQVYIDVIEYCQEEDIPLLFVVSPRVVDEEFAQRVNKLEEIANSYGVDFLDTNQYYEEMGLDFSTDFMNYNHVNVLGSDKYTTFLANYLVENYDFPDHREDKDYAGWDELYESYSVKHSESIVTCKEKILSKQTSEQEKDTALSLETE